MSRRRSPSSSKLLKEVNMDNFLQPSHERNDIVNTMREVARAMERSPTEYRMHLEKVQSFLTALWKKYDCEDIIRILDALAIVEPPLLDLERGPLKRYRDHYVHIFNVFVLGLRVLSLIIKKLGGNAASDLLKVRPGSIRSEIPEFHDYKWEERLFYLWTLISNFHDISIPVTHLDGVRDGLNEFLKKFGLEVSGPALLPYFPSDLEDYFHLLGGIFEGKIEPDTAIGWCYEKDRPNSYVQGVLRREFAKQNHGCLSGFLMYKKIQEIFLEGRNKRPLSPRSFVRYTDYVLRQDIARAALAISLHDLGPQSTGYPRFLPLDFSEYPLTCLLIIVDSLQEYLRWEGTSIRGGTKLLLFPELALHVRRGGIELEVAFFVTDEPNAQRYLIDQAGAMAAKKGGSPRGSSLGDAAQDLCDSMATELASRWGPSKAFQVVLSFWESGKELFSRNVHI